MFRRRQVWLPTWSGTLLLVVVLASSGLIALRYLAGYLAAGDPATARDGRGAARLEELKQAHAALRPNRRSRKVFFSLVRTIGTVSPARRRAASR